MNDEEKIKWFDDTVKWYDSLAEQFGDPMDACDSTADPALDIFADFAEQWRKVKKTISNG